MAENSKIEWTDATWNPVTGCSVVSPGCTNCYAMRMAARLGAMTAPDRARNGAQVAAVAHYRGLTQPSKAGPVWTGNVALSERALLKPLRRRKPTTYFVNSMSDLFHESVPDEWIDRVFAVMALCPQHTFQCLTKRSRRMQEYCVDPRTPYRIARRVVDMAIAKQVSVNDDWPVLSEGDVDLPDDIRLRVWPLPNVWLGVSAEDQKRADERIPDLLATPAAVRFVSCEPLLSNVDLSKWLHDGRRESILGTGCIGPLQSGWRQNLAPSEVDRRRPSRGSDLHATVTRGEERSQSGQLSEGDVQGRRAAQEGQRASHRVDDRQPPPHSARDGSEPFGWEQTEQRSIEPRDRHSSAKRATLPHAFEAEEKGSARGEEFGSGRDGSAGDRNTSAMVVEGHDTARDRGAVQRDAIDDIGNRHAQELGAPSVNWIIVGGESGPNARPMRVEWPRAIRDQCAAAGVAYFFKQWGEFAPDDQCANRTAMVRVGKKAAGRLLDGRTHDDTPARRA